MTAMLKLKRIYDQPSPSDGMRILVERLWPRAVSKQRARVDLWLKDVAPSTELRQWYGHDPAKWKQFRQRYQAELRARPDALELLKHKSKEGTVTLIFATKDEKHSGALVLKQFLNGRK
jgi:uncharacterized protein YeaO (DUF488 family)